MPKYDIPFPEDTESWGTHETMSFHDTVIETPEKRLAALASIRETFDKHFTKYYGDNAASKTDTEFAEWLARYFLPDIEQALYERGGE